LPVGLIAVFAKSSESPLPAKQVREWWNEFTAPLIRPAQDIAGENKIMKDQILRYRKEIIFAGIIFLASTLSFGVGYLSALRFNHAPIVIEQCSDIENQ
jgi:hypothetical protein